MAEMGITAFAAFVAVIGAALFAGGLLIVGSSSERTDRVGEALILAGVLLIGAVLFFGRIADL